MEIEFPRDTEFRQRMFVADHFSHPAKLDAQLLIWIVEHYTEEGETILDPMAGSGTAMLACQLGRNVVLVELENKFIKMCEDNWAKVRQMPSLFSRMGECQIMQGDARNLEGLLVDKCICSPPYEGSVTGDLEENAVEKRKERLRQAGYDESYIDGRFTEYRVKHGNMGIKHYSDDISNIGNLKSDTYLSAMLRIYRNCFRVLKPQGLMILVVKPFIRDQKLVPLQEDTKQLCKQVGFSFLEEHHRILPSQSFWRVIYAQRFPNAPKIDREYVLVFKKG